MNITVYLGAKEGNDPALKRAVQELGQWIGQSGNALVYGGSKTGLMGEIAKSVLDAGGTVTGVETTLFMQDDLQYDGLTELIVTETITERKTEMIRRGDAFIAFPGGTGTLELSQEEDILEAGIQIISQPPGKKLQNMMQLSGGEKALTAIALLFAIQNLKPSPFCLLDEIEAALDDSNVDRFAGYLHKLTRYTQFIVITHRRGTMVSADRLYGITMQEKGVSTLVSVSLIEAQMEREEEKAEL